MWVRVSNVCCQCHIFSYQFSYRVPFFLQLTDTSHDCIKLQYFPNFSVPQCIQRDISNQNNCYLFGMWSQKYFQSFSFSMWYSQPTSKKYLSFCYCRKMSILSWISFHGMLFCCFLFWHRLRKREPNKKNYLISSSCGWYILVLALPYSQCSLLTLCISILPF